TPHQYPCVARPHTHQHPTSPRQTPRSRDRFLRSTASPLCPSGASAEVPLVFLSIGPPQADPTRFPHSYGVAAYEDANWISQPCEAERIERHIEYSHMARPVRHNL